MAADRTVDDALRGAADDVHRAAAAATGGSPASRRTRPARRARSWWTAGLVAAAVVAVVLVPTRLFGPGNDHPGPAPVAGRSTPPEPTAPAPTPAGSGVPTVTPDPQPTGTLPASPACGSTTLPVPLHLPDGYRGPFPGPAEGAPEPAGPTQLVLHWTGSGGDIEARWPLELGPGGAGTSEYLTMTGPLGADPDVTAMIKVPKRTGQCEVIGLAIYGQSPPGFGNPLSPFRGSPEDPPEVRAKFVALATIVTDPEQLTPVRGSQRLGSAPKGALPCTGNAEEPVRRGDVTGSPPQPSARSALSHWLIQEGGFELLTVELPLTELKLPGGTVMFGRRFDGGPGYVGLVWMTKTGSGWAVDRWETSGC